MQTSEFPKYIPLFCVAVIAVCLYFASSTDFMQSRNYLAHLPAEKQTSVDDVTITIKTTQNNLDVRIPLLLKTWLKSAINQSFVITDASNDEVEKLFPAGHVMSANCSKGRGKWLCCKTGEEFRAYVNDGKKKWWCHFDDDVYVNVNMLLQFLNTFDADTQYIYAGQLTRFNAVSRVYNGSKIPFRHITGATYCISRALNRLIDPWIRGKKKMMKTCGIAQAADDVSLGFLINGVLNVSLMTSKLFHSHIGTLWRKMRGVDLLKQVTLSYRSSNTVPFNANYQPLFNKTVDPTRFLSIHCLINPDDEICKTG